MPINMKKNIVYSAAALARQLHRGQVDKAGVDYFSRHLTTVAKMETDTECDRLRMGVLGYVVGHLPQTL